MQNIQQTLFTTSHFNTRTQTGVQAKNVNNVPQKTIVVPSAQSATKMSMTVGPSASMGPSTGPIFKSQFTSSSSRWAAAKPAMAMGSQPSSSMVMKMSQNNKFTPTSYISSSLNQMKNLGFSAAAKNTTTPARSSVVMEAGPTVSGSTSNQDIDMQFYDRKFLKSNNPFADEITTNAKKLGGSPGKGILATDESNYTIGIRFEGIGVENTMANRIGYRSMLYRTPGINQFFSGAIMFDETARATDSVSGKTTIELLQEADILPGIKIDIGLKEIPGTFGEVATQGLDNIADKAKEYYELGIRFAKWRAVIKVDEANGCPSDQHIMEIAHSLARYGAACQHNGLVPIIEPEILMDGNHSIEDCYRISDKVLQVVVGQLKAQNLLLEGLVLKPNMVTKGFDHPGKNVPEEVAYHTIKNLSKNLPSCVPGVTFLSGGQAEEQASLNLNAMNSFPKGTAPWNLSFSYGRALQTSVLQAWKGDFENNTKAAQDALYARGKANSEAALGIYAGGQGSVATDFVADYKY